MGSRSCGLAVVRTTGPSQSRTFGTIRLVVFPDPLGPNTTAETQSSPASSRRVAVRSAGDESPPATFWFLVDDEWGFVAAGGPAGGGAAGAEDVATPQHQSGSDDETGDREEHQCGDPEPER